MVIKPIHLFSKIKKVFCGVTWQGKIILSPGRIAIPLTADLGATQCQLTTKDPTSFRQVQTKIHRCNSRSFNVQACCTKPHVSIMLYISFFKFGQQVRPGFLQFDTNGCLKSSLKMQRMSSNSDAVKSCSKNSFGSSSTVINFLLLMLPSKCLTPTLVPVCK